MAIKDKPTANQLAALMHIYGVKHVVVSPGSRNAPVILALSRSGKYELHYIVDERTAAFAALGMAVTLDSPVAMVCTSGSAVLNYGPALAEAYHSHIPLIALSLIHICRQTVLRDRAEPSADNLPGGGTRPCDA